MDDVSDFFKSGFLSLHKNKIEKNYQQKTLKERMNNFNNIRRETRNTLMFQKRNIDVNMTPLNTPEPSKIIKKAVEKKRPNKRLEMLNKWKAEKEKRKQEEKKKAKPLFKVYHVPISVGLPDLEKVNKEIKGKPISQFAPPNHKFHAPKNVKPISLNSSTSNNTSTKLISTQKPNFSEQNLTRQKSSQLQNCTTRITRSRAMESTTLRKQASNISQKGDSNTKCTTKKASEKSTHSSNTTEKKNHFIQQNNTKPKQNVPSLLKHKKENVKISSSSGTFNTKSTSKCSPPKKSKNDNQNLSNESSTNLVSSEKRAALNKIKNQKVKKNLDGTSEIRYRNSKHITTINENEDQIKDHEKSRNGVAKSSAKSKKSLGCTSGANVKCGRIEVPSTNEHENEFEGYKKSNNDLCKTPTNYRKSRNKSLEKVEWKITKVGSTTTEKNHSEEGQVKSKEILKTPTKSQKSTKESSKKSVGWNVLEMVDSDNENIYKTPKTNPRKYKKTPRKAEKSDINNVDIEETLREDGGQIESSPTTPKNNSENISTSPVYISPFVTISRGKTSARKEYQVRHSPTSVSNDPEFTKTVTNNSTSPKAGAEYFSRKLCNEIERIQNLCAEWNKYRNENSVPDEANDLINVVIGQSNLLITKKFEQFKSLIDQCRNFDFIEKPITCEDLHGFWDMTYMQVEDLDKRFKNLNDLKTNNWKEVIPEKKPVVKRGRGRPKKATGSSSLRNMIKAAREKKKSNDSETNEETPAVLISQSDNNKVFTGGYYEVKSPIKDVNVPHQSPLLRSNSSRRSLRVSLLAHQVKNRISSPGLTMMKVSQAIKSGDGLTPSKSILKSDLTKSAARITKSVLFKDDLEEDIQENLGFKSESLPNMDINKENDCNEVNMIIFSPQTPTRRSRRLAKTK